MPTLMQKIRLVLRGWSRRREEKQRAFLSQNAGWGAALTPQAMRPPSEGPLDLEGLTVLELHSLRNLGNQPEISVIVFQLLEHP